MAEPTTASASQAGNISMRQWICWDKEHASEPTTTLVLTSPANTFVDVRLTLPTPFVATAERPLPNTGGPFDRLDWAFAGAAETPPPLELAQLRHASAHAPLVPVDIGAFAVRRDGGGGGGGLVLRVPRRRWRHLVDSRYPGWGEEPAADEGDMYPVLGRPEMSLEIGRMERVPGSGVACGYQELWVDVKARPVGGERVRRGAVLSLDMPERKARGFVVRVAQFVQGLLIIDGEVTLERWEHGSGAPGAPPGWQRSARLGSRFLPCAWTFEGKKALADETAVGSELVDGEMRWTVVEKFEW